MQHLLARSSAYLFGPIFALFHLILLTGAVVAEPSGVYTLTTADGKPLPTYDRLLHKIDSALASEPSKVVKVVIAGKTYGLSALRGEGASAKVYATDQKGVALRLPVNASALPQVQRYLNAHADLLQGRAPVIAIKGVAGSPAFALLVDDLGPAPVSFRQFLRKLRTATNEERPVALEKLMQLARGLAPFEDIGDLRADQIFVDPRTDELIVVDFDTPVKRACSEDSPTALRTLVPQIEMHLSVTDAEKFRRQYATVVRTARGSSCKEALHRLLRTK